LIVRRLESEDLTQRTVFFERSGGKEYCEHEYQRLHNERLAGQELVEDMRWPSSHVLISMLRFE
jgi:hypothetical protein